MSYSQENGYLPSDFQTIMGALRVKINEQFGTTYTSENFEGTNFYKYFYALAQKVQDNEVLTAEIFIKLQDYIASTNERISRPVNTNTGIIDRLKVLGYTASVKKIIEADAGKINICIDVDDSADDYATVKTEIATLISQITVAGCVTQGDESETIVLSNGQSFDFKFHLPNKIPVLLRLTIETSKNNLNLIGDPDDTKFKLIENINARYRLGLDFEPKKYFDIDDDAPWAGDIKLEWSDDDGATWSDDIYDATFEDLFTFGLDDITLVET